MCEIWMLSVGKSKLTKYCDPVVLGFGCEKLVLLKPEGGRLLGDGWRQRRVKYYTASKKCILSKISDIINILRFITLTRAAWGGCCCWSPAAWSGCCCWRGRKSRRKSPLVDIVIWKIVLDVTVNKLWMPKPAGLVHSWRWDIGENSSGKISSTRRTDDYF